ncbi:hypothetical protein BKA69DRAFT_1123074 [Paraphysoderma sedebokerense]|nr:hypothetical protein BKA69DRAFT_1123074 [Paraphysoderma sedebokerense]
MKVLCPIPGCRKRIAVSRFNYLLSHTENTAIHVDIVPDICKFDECNVTVSDYVDIEDFYREHYLPSHYNLNFSRNSRKRRRPEAVSEAANNDYGFDGNCCSNFAVAMNSFTMEEESFRTIVKEELADLGIPQTLTEIREGIEQISEGIGQLIQFVSEKRVQNEFRSAALPSYKGEYTTVKKENQSSSKQLRMLPLLKAIIPSHQQFRTADNIIQHVATMRGLLVSDEQKGILRDFANRHGLTEDDTLHKCGEYWINRAKNWKQWTEGATVKPEFMELGSELASPPSLPFVSATGIPSPKLTEPGMMHDSPFSKPDENILMIRIPRWLRNIEMKLTPLSSISTHRSDASRSADRVAPLRKDIMAAHDNQHSNDKRNEALVYHIL